MKAAALETASAASRPRNLARRGARVAGWLVPGTLLALMPKCPACVAAYLAMATGIGVSLPVAAQLRLTLIVICAASLAFWAMRRIGRRLRHSGAEVGRQ